MWAWKQPSFKESVKAHWLAYYLVFENVSNLKNRITDVMD